MWLAAIAALVMGGPLGACMFVAAGIAHYLKISKVDAEYASRGEMTPGAKLIDKWLEGRKVRGKAKPSDKPARYGMWRYFWQRWCAMWEVLAEGHKIQHQRYLQERNKALLEGKPEPKRPTLKDQAAAGWQWMVDTVGVPIGNILPTRAAAKAAPAAPAESADGPVIACDECGVTLADPNGGWGHPAGSGCPKAAQSPRGGEPGQAWPSGGTDGPAEPDVPADSGRTAPDTVRDQRGTDHQPHPGHEGAPSELKEPNEGDNMPARTDPQQQTGEVVGLMSAINYADTVAAAHGQHSTGGGEQYQAALGHAEVGEETIASAARAQEASAIAQAAWAEHAGKLREQLAAKEVTTSETGKKEFLLAE